MTSPSRAVYWIDFIGDILSGSIHSARSSNFSNLGFFLF
ncbi:MAG: hypothetical protein CM1200mP29_08920 [Verrucomicrobiota bacterium]|nr:MAG: hypothetical protein CM1200mP29_08920 [Verrucomicrobiota bacterium]